MTNTTHRVKYLDGVRGIAILLVFAAHLIHGVGPHDRPFIEGFFTLAGGGFIGVQLFFVLSGYLITNNLISEFNQKNRISFSNFYLKRIWRLYPVLILACFAYLAFGMFIIEKKFWIAMFGDVFQALTYTTNLYIAAIPDLGHLSHTWSLCVEEQFYLFWPIILTIFAFKKNILIPIFLLIFACIMLRYFISDYSYGIFRWDSLMIGCLISFNFLPKNIILLFIGIAIVIYFAFYISSPISNIEYLISSIGCGLFIANADNKYMHFLNSRFLIYFGHISYSLYIWHLLFMRLDIPGYISLVGSLLIAHVSFRFFEKPILIWARNKFSLH